jgi:hypothetical protein
MYFLLFFYVCGGRGKEQKNPQTWAGRLGRSRTDKRQNNTALNNRQSKIVLPNNRRFRLK